MLNVVGPTSSINVNTAVPTPPRFYAEMTALSSRTFFCQLNNSETSGVIPFDSSRIYYCNDFDCDEVSPIYFDIVLSTMLNDGEPTSFANCVSWAWQLSMSVLRFPDEIYAF